MYTIGKLVKQFKLSRSTLLYYDKKALLKPSGRNSTNYRLYTEDDVDRLSQIILYKKAGLSLEEIKVILDDSHSEVSKILEKRLDYLNEEISEIRKQQQHIINILGEEALWTSSKVMNKAQWIQILKSSGMDEQAMRQWHIAFERDLPEAHTDFLESLGIESEEITEIKAWAQMENM